VAITDDALVGHWPLTLDTNDHGPHQLVTRAVDVELGRTGPVGEPRGAAAFNGRTSLLEVADHPVLRPGTGEVTFAAWVHTDERTDVVGQLFGKFDALNRRGIHLYMVTNSGVTSTAVPNHRHLQFGMDAGRLDADWQDCGRPGNAILVTSLLASQGLLYAGTCEGGRDQIGHLCRYDGGQKWTDLGNPLRCNAIHSVTEFDGAIYCGLGRFNMRGSALGTTLNATPGGKVFRLEPDGTWAYRGHPGWQDATPEDVDTGQEFSTGKADDVIALTVFDGRLYCASNHRRGVFRYEGGTEWTHVGLEERILSLAIYRGHLYAVINGNGGPLYRFEGGSEWTRCGRPEDSDQTYSAVIHYGRLYVGTWPRGTLHRYEGNQTWRQVWIGFEREIMGTSLYNGKVYFGVLPSASVMRFDGDGSCALVGTLDRSAAQIRRAWSMAIHEGKLFAGTLPSGHVWSFEAGKMATWDRRFGGGWHHVAAVKDSRRLRLYVDGAMVAWSAPYHPADYDLDNDQPLHIGFGAFEHFHGLMSDVRLYRRALTQDQIAALARA
jgi:hypothetical protein